MTEFSGARVAKPGDGGEVASSPTSPPAIHDGGFNEILPQFGSQQAQSSATKTEERHEARDDLDGQQALHVLCNDQRDRRGLAGRRPGPFTPRPHGAAGNGVRAAVNQKAQTEAAQGGGDMLPSHTSAPLALPIPPQLADTGFDGWPFKHLADPRTAGKRERTA